MQTRNRFFDDLAKVANSAVGTMAGMKGEIERMVRHRVENFIDGMNLVTREEFRLPELWQQRREMGKKNLKRESLSLKSD